MVVGIQGIEDVRSHLPKIVASLRENPHQALRFGRHRRDEAVLTSAVEYDRLEAAASRIEELERTGAIAVVSDRLADGRFSEGTVDDLFAAVDAIE